MLPVLKETKSLSRTHGHLCLHVCVNSFSPHSLKKNPMITNGQMAKIRLLWFGWISAFEPSLLEEVPTVTAHVSPPPPRPVQAYTCVSRLLAAPDPDIFIWLALLAGVFLSLPLYSSQQSFCPPAGSTPTSTPPPDFKHVVLGARVMAVPSICSHRKQISPDLKMCTSLSL